MKKTVSLICFLVISCLLLLSSCSGGGEYEPKGEFYLKTPAARGDRGEIFVIDIETEKRSYEGDGDLRVRSTVGFGHLPGDFGYGEGSEDHLRVEYLIIEAPWGADKRPSWEMVTDYENSFYDEKYNSTEKEDDSFLCIPSYGDFYPTFKEEVTLTFPEEVERGYLEIRLYDVFADGSAAEIAQLRVYFEREDGVLTLDP
jgi:hypothetical protein